MWGWRCRHIIYIRRAQVALSLAVLERTPHVDHETKVHKTFTTVLDASRLVKAGDAKEVGEFALHIGTIAMEYHSKDFLSAAAHVDRGHIYLTFKTQHAAYKFRRDWDISLSHISARAYKSNFGIDPNDLPF